LVGSNINQPGTWTRIKPRIVLDPGHGQYFVGGVLQYQRPATPTLHLFEDNLTLTIAQAAKTALDPDYDVLMTRTGARAEHAPADCLQKFPGHGCGPDLRWRRSFAEKHEADVLVSIHTNGGSEGEVETTSHGTSAKFQYFTSVALHSTTLATELVDAVSPLTLRNRGISFQELAVLSPLMVSSLIEVAVHNNSIPAPDETITDEQRLNNPDFLAQAGRAIKTGIDNYFTHIAEP
jgi:N-acetylmuramoyl-L-alanine amidase